MAFDRSSRPGQADPSGVLDQIYAPPRSGFDDPPQGWEDPEDARSLLRLRLKRIGFGFSTLALALILASLSAIGTLFLLFVRQRANLGAIFGIDHWDLLVDSAIVWGSTAGAALLWGRWPDRGWTRRSGLLLLMCLADVVLWSLEHARDLGLADAEMGHEWFRRSVGQVLGWSEFALIASLAADLAARLGEPQAIEYGRAARSLATTGAMLWFLYFYTQTDWDGQTWPLRMRRLNIGSFMLMLCVHVLATINLVQVSVLSLLASRCCGQEVRRMAVEDRRRDDFPPAA